MTTKVITRAKAFRQYKRCEEMRTGSKVMVPTELTRLESIAFRALVVLVIRGNHKKSVAIVRCIVLTAEVWRIRTYCKGK